MKKVCKKCGKVFTTLIWGAYAEESAQQCCKYFKADTETAPKQKPPKGK